MKGFTRFNGTSRPARPRVQGVLGGPAVPRQSPVSPARRTPLHFRNLNSREDAFFPFPHHFIMIAKKPPKLNCHEKRNIWNGAEGPPMLETPCGLCWSMGRLGGPWGNSGVPGRSWGGRSFFSQTQIINHTRKKSLGALSKPACGSGKYFSSKGLFSLWEVDRSVCDLSRFQIDVRGVL